MRGRLVDLSFSLGGRQRVTFEIDGDFREEADRLQGCELDIAVKKHRKRRSLDANAYFWALCGKLAAATGQPREAVYRACIRDIGGNYETVCVQECAAEKLREGWGHNGLGWVTDTMPSKLPGCVNLLLYYGSSTYDGTQMARLIDNIVQDCKAAGIETMTPDELAKLEGYGENEQEHYAEG